MKDIQKFPKGKLPELASTPMDELQSRFPGYRRDDLRRLRRQHAAIVSPDERVRIDLKEKKLAASKRETDGKYRRLQDEFERVQRENAALLRLSEPVESHVIKPLDKHEGGESTVILLASDWHIEERVSPDAVNNMNSFSVPIARQRADAFFKVGLHLTQIEQNNTPINTLVLALLGDFITGFIHEENLAVCSLPPVEAGYEALVILQSGIDFLLANSELNLVIPCHAGNHGRITKKSRSSETEMGNSLEYFIYGFLAKHYEGNPRVKFLISRSYISRLQVYDTVLRFHHGHRIRFQGGVGGLTIPAKKWTFRSNRAWTADYDIFGHHHQAFHGGNFICNGSLIGYNAYAQDNGFEFEPPSQTYLLINRRWKQIVDYRPIFV